MPELLRKLPARMNSGTASSAKFCVSVTVSWIGMVAGSSGCCRKKSAPEMPIAKATGMPISRSTVKAMRTISIGAAAQNVDRLGLRVLAAQLGAHLQRGGDSSSIAPTGRLMVTHE